MFRGDFTGTRLDAFQLAAGRRFLFSLPDGRNRHPIIPRQPLECNPSDRCPCFPASPPLLLSQTINREAEICGRKT